jgi:hypothetical protein
MIVSDRSFKTPKAAQLPTGARLLSTPPHPDLVKVTEIFLVPSSFLVAALGTADTNYHRAAVSLLGLIISFLWWLCSCEAYRDDEPSAGEARKPPRRSQILIGLSVVFSVGWLASLVVHLALGTRPIG